jgi:hypothetical protein
MIALPTPARRTIYLPQSTRITFDHGLEGSRPRLVLSCHLQLIKETGCNVLPLLRLEGQCPLLESVPTVSVGDTLYDGYQSRWLAKLNQGSIGNLFCLVLKRFSEFIVVFGGELPAGNVRFVSLSRDLGFMWQQAHLNSISVQHLHQETQEPAGAESVVV